MSTLLLADAKKHLQISGVLAGVTDDAELQSFINAAERVISEHCGPIVSEATTSRVSPVGTRLGLPVTPVVSLTSVTPVGGSALTLGDLHLDQRAGVVTLNSGAAFSSQFYDVVYQAGRAQCPDDLLMAVKELLRHMWSTQRAGATRPGSKPSDATANTVPGAAYLLPFRVSELIAPHMQYGFA